MTSIKNECYDVATVLVTFNSGDVISDCIAHLEKTLEDTVQQLVIVDNASTDQTRLWLKKNYKRLKASFHRLDIILNSSNLGFTHAVNQGLKIHHGKHVLILNPDVFVQPETLNTLLAVLKENPRIGVIAPQLRYPDQQIQPSCRRFPNFMDVLLEVTGLSRLSLPLKTWKMTEFDHHTSRDVEQPQGAFLLARADVIARVGLLDERFFMFFSDVDWCQRVIEAGWRIYFFAETYVIHQKGSSIYRHRARMIVSSHRSFYDYMNKYQKTGTNLVYLILTSLTWLRLLYLALSEPVNVTLKKQPSYK